MDCPNCNGPVWDNRARKAEGKMNPKAPDFSCKDKEVCKWVQWPDRNAKVAAPSVAKREPMAVRDVFDLYCECRNMAVEAWRGTKVADDPSALTTACHTLFIDARKEGRRAAKKVSATKKVEKPMPPMPTNDEWEEVTDDDGPLPF